MAAEKQSRRGRVLITGGNVLRILGIRLKSTNINTSCLGTFIYREEFLSAKCALWWGSCWNPRAQVSDCLGRRVHGAGPHLPGLDGQGRPNPQRPSPFRTWVPWGARLKGVCAQYP